MKKTKQEAQPLSKTAIVQFKKILNAALKHGISFMGNRVYIGSYRSSVSLIRLQQVAELELIVETSRTNSFEITDKGRDFLIKHG